MAANKTSLSAGEIVHAVLRESPEVREITDNVFPIIADKAELPYIVYRRSALEPVPQKSAPANDAVEIEVLCYGRSYDESVRLAEAVRGALDHRSAETEDLRARSILLVDASEFFEADAWAQQLVFRVKI